MDGSLRQLIRFFFLGPFLGAVIGVVQTSVAVHIWLRQDEARTLFRNYDSVVIGYMIFSVGGFIVGAPFGLVLLSFEETTEREIPVTWFVTWASLAAAFISFVVVELEVAFHHFVPFANEAAAIIVATALAWVLSARKSIQTGSLPDA